MTEHLKFKGKKYKKNGKTWTKEYDKWRRKHGLCNSPRAWCLMKKEELRKKEAPFNVNILLWKE